MTRAEYVAAWIANRFRAPCPSLPGDKAVYTKDTVALYRKDGSMVAIMSRENYRRPQRR